VYERQKKYSLENDETHIIIFASNKYSETAINERCFVYPTKNRFKFFYPFSAISLGRFIIQRRGVTHITCQDPSFTAMAGIALKREFGLPLEIQIHTDIGSPNYTYSLKNRILKAMALSYIPKADSIRVVSNKIKNYLVENLAIPASKILVKPIDVDRQFITETPVTVDLHSKYPQFSKIVLMASRFTKEKNIGYAIKSWIEVVKTYPDYGLIIVGEGILESKLKSMVAGNGLVSKVIFEPWQDRKTLISYYKTCDYFLNTSLFEGYGMSMVEAGIAGAVVVSTDVGVAREIGATIISGESSSLVRVLEK